MNKERRKTITILHARLSDLLGEIEAVRDEEQEYFDNMPESLQSGETGDAAQEAISFLEDACLCAQEAMDALESTI